jgi:hypothetical protein
MKKQKLIEEILAIVTAESNSTDLYLMDHISEPEVDQILTDLDYDPEDPNFYAVAEAITEHFENANEDRQITDEEVIYYGVAMEYLKENDPSLRESLDIAMEYGFDGNNLSSETLASLLKSRNNETDFIDALEEIQNQIENLG